MIFNMTGSGSGAGLNFKVVGGTTKPSNPSENTIWVNTSVTIPGWVFSAKEPAGDTTEGTIWFSTGVSSPVEFNALKKNSIVLCPLSAKQYVVGGWVDIQALTYKNGEWNSWIVYLFNNGDQCTDLTGGWSSSHGDDAAWSFDGNYGSSPDYGGGAWINDDVMSVAIHTNTNLRCGVAAVGTKNKIDLTSYKKIKAVCNVNVTNPCITRLAINSSLTTPQNSPPAYVDIPAGASTVELDISNVSGLYHIIIGGMIEDSEDIYGCGLDISAVIIE